MSFHFSGETLGQEGEVDDAADHESAEQKKDDRNRIEHFWIHRLVLGHNVRKV
jgi:uncharacterized protein YegJ (DUF2314 family)